MKKIAVATAVLSLMFSASVLAEDVKPAPNFDQRKAEVLKRLDDQMRSLQESITCITAAANQNEMKACKEKQMIERRKLRGEMKRK